MYFNCRLLGNVVASTSIRLLCIYTIHIHPQYFMTLSVVLDVTAWYYTAYATTMLFTRHGMWPEVWLLTSSLWCYELTYVPTSTITIYFSILQMNILCKINYMYVNLGRQKNIIYRDGVQNVYICIWFWVVKLCCQALYIRLAFLFTFFLVLKSQSTSYKIIHLNVGTYIRSYNNNIIRLR